MMSIVKAGLMEPSNCIKKSSICIPQNYSKYDLPSKDITKVSLGLDIRDISKIDYKDFSITIVGYLSVQWMDPRLIINNGTFRDILDAHSWITLGEESFTDSLWRPDLGMTSYFAISTHLLGQCMKIITYPALKQCSFSIAVDVEVLAFRNTEPERPSSPRCFVQT